MSNTIRPRSPKLIGQVDFAASSKFTDKFRFNLEETEDGGHVHIERLMLRLEGDMHWSANSADVIVKPDRLVKLLRWHPNGMPLPIIEDLSLDQLIALYRAENRGRFPVGKMGVASSGISVTTDVSGLVKGHKYSAVTATDAPFRLDVAVEFKRRGLQRPDDGLLPVRAVKDSFLVVHTGAVADAVLDDGAGNATLTILNGRISLYAWTRPYGYVSAETAPALDAVELASGETQKPLPAAAGSVETAIIKRSDGEAPTSTDMNTVGLRTGGYQAVATDTPQSVLVSEFNEDAEVALVAPEDVPAAEKENRHLFLPLEWPGKTPQRALVEGIDARRGGELRFEAISQNYRLIRRRRLFGPDVSAKMDRKMELTGVARNKALAAPTKASDVEGRPTDALPAKVYLKT